MVERDELMHRARWAAERGRLRMACRVGLAVLPLGGLSWLAGAEPASCAGLSLALFGLTAGLRWWHREGVEAVRVGLSMGLSPLVAILLLRGCGVDCASWDRLTEPELACILAGILAGVGIAARAIGDARGPRFWALATLVAAATAALGCIGLGLGGLLVTTGALVASSAVAWVPLRARLA